MIKIVSENTGGGFPPPPPFIHGTRYVHARFVNAQNDIEDSNVRDGSPSEETSYRKVMLFEQYRHLTNSPAYVIISSEKGPSGSLLEDIFQAGAYQREIYNKSNVPYYKDLVSPGLQQSSWLHQNMQQNFRCTNNLDHVFDIFDFGNVRPFIVTPRTDIGVSENWFNIGDDNITGQMVVSSNQFFIARDLLVSYTPNALSDIPINTSWDSLSIFLNSLTKDATTEHLRTMAIQFHGDISNANDSYLTMNVFKVYSDGRISTDNSNVYNMRGYSSGAITPSGYLTFIINNIEYRIQVEEIAP